MKRVFKKNQIMITILTLMIAAAGYLNYSGKLFKPHKDKAEEANINLADKELLDISEEDLETVNDDITNAGEEVEGTPGEAVLAGAPLDATVASAKLLREQVRAQNKETLQNIIDNTSVTEEQKQIAVASLVRMTELAEQESSVEMMMAAKGFTEAVVSITENSADIMVNKEELSDAGRARIEDIVTRKTNIPAENIVITPFHTETE